MGSKEPAPKVGVGNEPEASPSLFDGLSRLFTTLGDTVTNIVNATRQNKK